MESTINLGKNKPGSTAIEKLKAALFKKDSNMNTAEFRNILDELEHEHIELQKKSGELNERTKELSLFFHIFELVIQEDISENGFLQSLTDKIPEAWQYPEYTCVRIFYGNKAFSTSNFKQTRWCLSADIMVNHIKAGSIEVYYLEKMPEKAEGPFLKEERSLINSIAIKTGHYLERKIMQEEFVKSEERWHFALESAGDGVWDWDLKTNQVFFSDQWKKMLGYKPHELKNELEEWEIRVHSDDLEKAKEDISKHLNHEKPYYLNEHRLRCKDGSYKWILDRGKVVASDKNGKPLRFIGTHTDITKLKNLQNTLKESEENFRLLVENQTDLVVKVNAAGEFLFVSPSYCKMFGKNEEELLGKVFLPMVHEDDRETTARAMETLNQPPHNVYVEQRAMTRDGWRWLAWVDTALMDEYGNTKEIIGVGRDITEQKIAEEKLGHSYKLLSYIIEHVNSAVAVHDSNLNYIYVSQRYLDQFNLKEKNIIGKHHYDVFPDLPQKWRDVHQRALKGDVLSADRDLFYRKDGSVEWTLWQCRPWHEADGSIGGIIVYTEVITERVEAENALRESESRFSIAFKASPAPLVISEIATGLFIDVNDRWVELLGYSREEQIGKTSKDVGIWRNPSERDRVIKQVLKNGFFKDEYIEFNTKTGETILALWSAETIVLSGKKLMLSMIHDITERIKAENELRKLKDSLQEMVEEKTKELNQRIEILERFHDATIEREFRIKELKEEIKRLKADKI